MLKADFITKVNQWQNWLAQATQPQYDIALFKIWIQMEVFCADIFIDYCLGIPSENNYTAPRLVSFQSEEQLSVFLREGSKKYIDYFAMIEKLSKHIFQTNPFEVITIDATYSKVCKEIKSIRNFVAHESSESEKKYRNECLSGGRFIDPNTYLLRKRGSESIYTYYINSLVTIVDALITAPA